MNAQTPEVGSREDAPAPTAAGPSPASGTYAPTPPPGDHGRGGVEAANQGKRPAGSPPTDGSFPSVARGGSASPPPRATERSRPDTGRSKGKAAFTPGREPPPPPTGEADYSAWIAELSGRPEIGTLARAFAYARWYEQGRP